MRSRGDAISFPYTVGSVPPLKFVLQQNGNQFQFSAVCYQTGQWTKIALDVRTATSHNTSSLGAATAEAHRCRSDNATVFSGLLFRTDELKQGKEVDIYFNVTSSQEYSSRSVKTGQTFIVGEGRKLYLADAARQK